LAGWGKQTATLFFILLFTGLYGASAETPGQPGTNSITTDSNLVGTETTDPQNPSPPAEQQEHKTGQAPKPVAQNVTSEQVGVQSDPCAPVNASGDTWLDRIHALVQSELPRPEGRGI